MRFLLFLACCCTFSFIACDGEAGDPNSAMDSATVNPVAITNPGTVDDAMDVEGSGLRGLQTAFERVETAVKEGDYATAQQAATALEVAYKGAETGRQATSAPLEQTANELFRAKLTDFQLSKTSAEQRDALEGLREAMEGLF